MANLTSIILAILSLFSIIQAATIITNTEVIVTPCRFGRIHHWCPTSTFAAALSPHTAAPENILTPPADTGSSSSQPDFEAPQSCLRIGKGRCQSTKTKYGEETMTPMVQQPEYVVRNEMQTRSHRTRTTPTAPPFRPTMQAASAEAEAEPQLVVPCLDGSLDENCVWPNTYLELEDLPTATIQTAFPNINLAPRVIPAACTITSYHLAVPFALGPTTTEYVSTSTETNEVDCGGCEMVVKTIGGHGPVAHFEVTVTVEELLTVETLGCSVSAL